MSLPEKNSFNNLGGELINRRPVENPQTDLDAEASNEMRADLAAMTRTATRCMVKFTISGGDGYVSNTAFDNVFGNSITYKPDVAYLGTGSYTVTFPETITDARGNERNINFFLAQASTAFATYSGQTVQARVTAPNVVEVKLVNSGGTAADPPTGTDEIYLIVI